MLAVVPRGVSHVGMSKVCRFQRVFPHRPQESRYSPPPVTIQALAVAMFALTAGTDVAWAVEKRTAAGTSCQAAQHVIDRDGAIILSYPSKRVQGLTLYNRFLRTGFQCDENEDAALQDVDAAGGSTCNLLACGQRTRGH